MATKFEFISKLVKDLQARLEAGQVVTGGCALVTALASSPVMDLGQVPDLDQFGRSEEVFGERAKRKLHHQPKGYNVNELVARFSRGQARLAGDFSLERDRNDGDIIDGIAREPAVALRVLSGDDEEIIRQERLTAMVIKVQWPKLGGEEVGPAHCLAVLPDDQVFTRRMRQGIKELGQPRHLVVDAGIDQDFSGVPGISFLTGREIVEVTTTPDSLRGEPRVSFGVVLTKR